MEGGGKFTFANGNYYIGGFLDGAFHGEGTVFFTPENGGGTYKATWTNGVAQEGTYFFHDGLKYEQEGWDYCTPHDRRFWREHNSFIVPPFAGPSQHLIVPDYGAGRVLEVKPHIDDWTQVEAPSPDGRGTPAQLAFLRLPSRIESGHPFTIVVEVQDKFGDCVIRARKLLDLQLLTGSGQFLYEGEDETQKGRVEFQCRYKGEGFCSFRALCQNLPSLDSPEIEAVVAAPYEGDLRPIVLQLEGIPSEVVEGEEFSVLVRVMELPSRKPLRMDDGSIKVVMVLKSGSGQLEGTVRTTNEGDSLLYYDLVYRGEGPFTLTCLPVTADTHVTESSPIQVTAADANITPTQAVVVSVVPLEPTQGQSLEVQAVLWDDKGRLAIRADDIPVQLRLGIGSGELDGAEAVLTSGGFAAFDGIAYSGLDPFTIVATAPGVRDSNHSKVLMAKTPVASLEVVSVQPLVQPPGEPYTVCVVAYDAAGDVVVAPDVSISLALAEGEGALSGTTSAVPTEGVSGYFVFTDVRFQGSGPFRLQAASDSGIISAPSPQQLFAGSEEDSAVPEVHPHGEARQLYITAVEPHDPAPEAACSLEVEVQDVFRDVCPAAVSVINVWLVMDAPIVTAVVDGGQVEVTDGKARVDLPSTGQWPFLVHLWAEGVGGAVSSLIGRQRWLLEDDIPTHLHLSHVSQPVRAGEPFQAVVEVRNAAGDVVPGTEAFVRLQGVGLPPVVGVPNLQARLGYAVFNGCSFPAGTDLSRGALQAVADGFPPSEPIPLTSGAVDMEAEETVPDQGDMLVFSFVPSRPCVPGGPFLVEVRVLNTEGALCQTDHTSAVTVSLAEGCEGDLSGEFTVVAHAGIARFTLQYKGGRSFHLVASSGRLVACKTHRPIQVTAPFTATAPFHEDADKLGEPHAEESATHEDVDSEGSLAEGEPDTALDATGGEEVAAPAEGAVASVTEELDESGPGSGQRAEEATMEAEMTEEAEVEAEREVEAEAGVEAEAEEEVNAAEAEAVETEAEVQAEEGEAGAAVKAEAAEAGADAQEEAETEAEGNVEAADLQESEEAMAEPPDAEDPLRERAEEAETKAEGGEADAEQDGAAEPPTEEEAGEDSGEVDESPAETEGEHIMEDEAAVEANDAGAPSE
eukprot:GGOE01058870.1.p1 GENE.GGOE01058870.1~~GGOE01058870.1.p1  ORF type:complete len:1182 (+),score=363.04 GGOE01058870.1:135-3548(+)